MRLPTLSLVLFLSACGGAQAIVRDPIESKCKDAGLRGCEDLADGVALYLDGQKPLGYDKVKQGVGVNMDEPEKIKTFATAMKLLQNAPGIGGYIAQLRPIIDMIDASADDAIKKGASRPRRERAEPSKGAAVASAEKGTPANADAAGDTSRLRTSTVLVPAHKRAKPCNALAQTGAGSVSDTQCVTAFEGPLLVTDIHVAPGCANELLVLSGEPQTPRWFVVIPSGMGASVHGAALVVPADEELVVAARPGTARGLRPDAACALTWTGRKG